jgi:hypothetical protein
MLSLSLSLSPSSHTQSSQFLISCTSLPTFSKQGNDPTKKCKKRQHSLIPSIHANSPSPLPTRSVEFVDGLKELQHKKTIILWSGRSLIRKQELTRKKGLWWVQYIYGLCAASNTVKYQSTCFPLWVWCKPYGPIGEGPNCLLLHFTLLAASYSWASHLAHITFHKC